MLVGIHQPHYLPWLRYFEKIARCDVFVVLDTVPFTKNGWQNRNKVKTVGGETLLTVPVHVELGQPLEAVEICGGAWRGKHWRTIAQAYGKAPHFDRYAEGLAAFYERDWRLLADLNARMLEWFCGELGIDTRIEYASALGVDGAAT